MGAVLPRPNNRLAPERGAGEQRIIAVAPNNNNNKNNNYNNNDNNNNTNNANNNKNNNSNNSHNNNNHNYNNSNHNNNHNNNNHNNNYNNHNNHNNHGNNTPTQVRPRADNDNFLEAIANGVMERSNHRTTHNNVPAYDGLDLRLEVDCVDVPAQEVCENQLLWVVVGWMVRKSNCSHKYNR
jgi:hypothetical protein